MEIGLEKQLLLDHHLVASIHGLERFFPPGRKENGGAPVLTPTRPWEDVAFGFYGSVIYDEASRMFRMWYHAWWKGVGYAESSDGLSWEKPELGLLDLDALLLDPTGAFDPLKASRVEFNPRPEWRSPRSLPNRWRGRHNNLVALDGGIASHAFTVAAAATKPPTPEHLTQHLKT